MFRNLPFRTMAYHRGPMPASRFQGAAIPDEIYRMLAEHQTKLSTAAPETVDHFPDCADDLLGNPISPDQHMTVGKYKASSLTIWGIYKEDKGYVKWCRSHINEESHTMMKQFKIFIAFVDKNKMDRVNAEREYQARQSQGPICPNSKAQVKNKNQKDAMKRGKATTRVREEESEMDWDHITSADEQDRQNRVKENWEYMTVRALNHEEMANQRIVAKMAQHPRAMEMISKGMK